MGGRGLVMAGKFQLTAVACQVCARPHFHALKVTPVASLEPEEDSHLLQGRLKLGCTWMSDGQDPGPSFGCG